MNIKCMIIEDEPLAVDVIEDFIGQVPFLKLVAICNDAFTAMEILNKEAVDLIFLDIHLPKLKGFEFLKMLKNPPLVVVTTAYHEFALKSYEFHVVDYLLKPIEFSRFMFAISKIVERKGVANDALLPVSIAAPALFVTVNKKKARIPFEHILYVESQRESIKIVTDSKTTITRYLISSIENELPGQDFIRIHRSFIINKNKVDFFDANAVEICGKEIPIGRSFKDFVLSRLGS